MIDFKNYIQAVPDFPKKGILFQDLSPLFANPGAFSLAIDQMMSLFDLKQIETFAGVESRGFILASAMAIRSGKGLSLIRKGGKLPPPVNGIDYELEYGHARLEMKPGKGRLVIVDDVLATGGTIQASVSLAKQSGYEVVDVGFLLNIASLNQFRYGAADQAKALVTIG